MYRPVCHFSVRFWKDSVSARFMWCSEAWRVFISGLARNRGVKWLQDQL